MHRIVSFGTIVTMLAAALRGRKGARAAGSALLLVGVAALWIARVGAMIGGSGEAGEASEPAGS